MKKLDKIARFYKSLSEPTRLEILKYFLKNKDCSCTCHLVRYLKKDQSVIFRHIKILEEAGIIKTEKNERYLLCKIIDKKKVKEILGE